MFCLFYFNILFLFWLLTDDSKLYMPGYNLYDDMKLWCLQLFDFNFNFTEGRFFAQFLLISNCRFMVSNVLVFCVVFCLPFI